MRVFLEMRLPATIVSISGFIPSLAVTIIFYNIVPFVVADVICSDSCWCRSIDGKAVAVCWGHNLTQIPSYFDKQLQEIVVMFNNISIIHDYVFHGLSNVSIILLQHNEIKELYEHALDGLYNLIYLDLSNNKINKIPSTVIQNNEMLKFLYLNHNELSISGPFLISASLAVLDISFCKITFLPHDAFIGTPNLTKLKINNNYISEFEIYAFRGVKKLEILSAGNNVIKSLDSMLFRGLDELRVLDFSNNSISMFSPNLLESNRQLQYLFLQNNTLTIMHSGPILISESLSHLDISFCNITFMPPEAFIHLPNLTTLRMIGNPLSYLHTDTMKPLTKLQIILFGPESNCSDLSLQNIFEYFEQKSVLYYAPPICSPTSETSITNPTTSHLFTTTTESPSQTTNHTVSNVKFYSTDSPSYNSSPQLKLMYVMQGYIVIVVTFSCIMVCR